MNRNFKARGRIQGLRRIQIWMLGLAVFCVLGIAGSASAIVTVDYILTPGSSLFTSITSNDDFFAGTGADPVWLDGSLGTPPVSYGGDVPQETLNILRVEFTDDGLGNIIDGTVTVTLLDYYHPVDSSVAGNANITGQNDSTLAGAVGMMTGGVVTSWSTNLSGLVHNELTCVNIIPTGLCGSFGLPADGDTSIVHDGAATLTISTAGAPDAASLPMTFNASFTTVSAEMELVAAIGRQYYVISGAVPAVPASDTGSRVVMIGLMTLLGLFVLRSGVASVSAMRNS